MRSPSWTSNFKYFLILATHGVLVLNNCCTCEFVADTYLPPVLSPELSRSLLPPGGYLPPTCPNFTLFHIPTQKCYDSGFQGPCGNKMIFLNVFPANEDSHVGECTCENSGLTENFWTRPLVLWPDTQECYFIYDQGPCPEGQWIVGNGGVRCEQIPCPTQYLAQRYSQSGRTPEDKQFLFSFEGKCYFTLTQGFCPEGKLAVFTNGNFDPKCQSQEEDKSQSQAAFGNSPANSCADGKVSFNNNCESQSDVLKK